MAEGAQTEELPHELGSCQHGPGEQGLQVGIEAFLSHGYQRGIQAAKRLLRREFLHAHHNVWEPLVQDVVKFVELRIALLQKPAPLVVCYLPARSGCVAA